MQIAGAAPIRNAGATSRPLAEQPAAGTGAGSAYFCAVAEPLALPAAATLQSFSSPALKLVPRVV